MKVANKVQKHLEIIGAVHIDDIATPSESLVSYASNPVKWEHRLGGVASNAACAAARYNNEQKSLSITLSAAVGDDSSSHSLYQTLIQLGVTPKFQIKKNSATGRYSAVMTHDGELFIGLADVSLAESLSAKEIIVRLGDSALDQSPKETKKLSHESDSEPTSANSALLLDANLSSTCLSELSSWAKKHSLPCAAMCVSPAKSVRLSPISSLIDILFCNRREALALTTDQPDNAPLWQLADALTLCGFNQFVLTDGSEPLIVQSSSERITVDISKARSTQNVNGAGDALAGASMAAWLNGYTLIEAVREFGLGQARAVVEGSLQSPHMTDSRSQQTP